MILGNLKYLHSCKVFLLPYWCCKLAILLNFLLLGYALLIVIRENPNFISISAVLCSLLGLYAENNLSLHAIHKAYADLISYRGVYGLIYRLENVTEYALRWFAVYVYNYVLFCTIMCHFYESRVYSAIFCSKYT